MNQPQSESQSSTQPQSEPISVELGEGNTIVVAGETIDRMTGSVVAPETPPDLISPAGTKWWLKNNLPHRVGGPAIVHPDGREEWWQNGMLHRTDGGPAYVHPNGTREWYENGKLHRLDGPARELFNGVRQWWVNGKRHRADGPAVERPRGPNTWWLNGKHVSEKVVFPPKEAPGPAEDVRVSAGSDRTTILMGNTLVEVSPDGKKVTAYTNDSIDLRLAYTKKAAVGRLVSISPDFNKVSVSGVTVKRAPNGYITIHAPGDVAIKVQRSKAVGFLPEP